MNEKTKQILRYVACGLGGLALGIGLLGGLSMCATSNRSTAESVNTILTTTPKRTAGSTVDGVPAYTFQIGSYWLTGPGTAYTLIYDLDLSTYDLSLYTTYQHTGITTWSSITNIINEDYENGRSSEADKVRFMASYIKSDAWGTGTSFYQAYFSFVLPTASLTEFAPMPFLMTTDWTNGRAMQLTQNQWAWSYQHRTPYFLNYEKSQIYILDTTATNVPFYYFDFQDVRSYYHSQGYSNGYDDGQTTGYNSGYADGYEDGSDNGLLFTSLGVNQLTWASSDLSWDDSTDTTQTMKLFDFKDGENSSYYVTLTDYSLGGGNAIVQVFKNGTYSNNEYATIARGTWNAGYTQLEIIPSNYLKFEFAQITIYYHNSIPNGWFTLSGIPANATGYEVGYQTGYREGYLASPGGQATENVFSLFTNAFDSVGGIFNLKIFGFLPLYWFFLTPIFIAIIALILRLVKH